MSQESIVATILQMKAFQDTQEQCRMGNMEGNKIFRHVQEVCESHSEIQELLMDVTENARSAIYGQITSQLRSLLPKEENENQGLDVSSLPTPLYNIIQLYHSETNAFRRVHRLIDLFEWAIKWHTVVVVSDLLREADISDELKVLFSSGLRVPSLGVWMHFFRAALEAIQRPSFPYAQWECLLEIEKKYQIVHFRNGYAHGATPSDEDCQKDCERLFPVLQKLISSPMFSALQVVYFDGNQNYRWVGAEKTPSDMDIPERRVVIVHKHHPSEKRIDLWPLAMNSIDPQHPQKGHQFFYFNALKNKSIEQLNYEYGLHFRDKKLWDVFHDSLPIDEWKRVTDPKLDLFRERIEALTEVFKGRQQEKERLRAFCLAGKGNQMVWGGPGIGKSALLAQVFKEIRGGVDADGVSLEGDYPHILPYFIRRGTETSMPERFLRHLCLQLDVMYELKGFGLGNSTGELSESLNLRLQQLSEQEETKRLVLFVDGLDEALGGNTTILRFIPTPKKWLTVLCASRQVPEVEEWYNRREHRDAFGVNPLSIFDIRALLYEVVDKYDEGLSQEYVTAIAAVSQGNPLYLKLLCDQLSAGIQQVGAIEELPTEMEDLYKEVLFRVTDRGRNENAHRLLLLLTEAKASLSAEVISDVLDISMTAANAALDDCMELLFEDPLTPDLLDYQLFHESLREYVRKTEKKSTEKLAVQLTDFCFGWRNLESHSLRYALEFASAHIKDRNDTERLWSLLYDEEYRKTQIKVSYQFEYSYAALLDGLECYVDKNGETEEAEARLAWLMLKGGELAREAIEGVDIAFVWFQEDPQKLDMALKRIDVLDEKGFFKACLKLLMIEVWRQRVLEKEQRSIVIPRKILEKMDEKIPEGTGTIDWSSFLAPEFMGWWIFLMITTWHEIDLIGVYRRGRIKSDLVKKFLKEGMQKNGSELDICIHEAIQVANRITSDSDKSSAFAEISKAFAEIGKMDDAINLAKMITRYSLKSKSFIDISKSFAKIGNTKDASTILNEAINVANRITSDWDKSSIFVDISKIFAEIGKIDDAINLANRITDDFHKSSAFAEISKTFAEIGKIDDAINLANRITDDKQKSSAFTHISKAFAKIGNTDDAMMILNKAIRVAKLITDDKQKSRAFAEISKAFAEIGKTDDAINLANRITDDFHKSEAFIAISKAFTEIGNTQEASMILNKALKFANLITNDSGISRIFVDIAKSFAKIGNTQEASKILNETINVANKITDDLHKELVFVNISEIFTEIGKTQDAISVANKITRYYLKSKAIVDISKSLAKIGNTQDASIILNEAINVAKMITDDFRKSVAFIAISKTFAEIGNTHDAINVANMITDDKQKTEAFIAISKTFTEIGNTQDASTILNEVINPSNMIPQYWLKSKSFFHLSKNFTKTEKESITFLKEALKYAKMITDNKQKSVAFISISKTFTEIGNTQDASTILNEAINVANMITDNKQKSFAFSEISKTFAEIGKTDDAIHFANMIIYDWKKSTAFVAISKSLAEIGKMDDAMMILNKAIHVANMITDNKQKSFAFSEISKTFAEIGKTDDAINLANMVTDDWDKSLAFIHTSKTFAAIGKMDDAMMILNKAIHFANMITSDRDKSSAFVHISREFIANNKTSLFHRFLSQNPFSSVFYNDFLPSYLSKIDVLHLRKSALISPFSYEITENNVLHLMTRHYKEGNEAYAHAIIRQCPQLGLQSLLPKESERVLYTYATLESWIDSITNEDDQEDIRSWARRVGKGTLTESDFAERVQDLLS